MPYIELSNTREVAGDVVAWFMREYIPDSLFFLTVEEKDLSGEGVLGWCVRETQNEFTIQIHSGLSDNYISILLHELSHMMRYYHGQEQVEEFVLKEELKLLNKYYENH